MTIYLPTTTAEALRMLAAVPDGITPMAGGTDLMVHWPQKHAEQERDYLDLSGVTDLPGHAWTDDALVLGARTTYWDIVRDARAAEEFPLLVEAARTVGAVQIQTRGTWAGNIVNASPAADGVPVLMAYDAVVTLSAASGDTQVPLDDFYLGYKEMRRRHDQLIITVRLPRRTHDVQIFEKVGTRAAQAITKVGVAITHSADGWRVVANSVAPTVRRCRAVEQLLEERVPVTAPAGLLPALTKDVSPIDDIRSTAEYRLQVLARVLYHHLRDATDFVI